MKATFGSVADIQKYSTVEALPEPEQLTKTRYRVRGYVEMRVWVDVEVEAESEREARDIAARDPDTFSESWDSAELSTERIGTTQTDGEMSDVKVALRQWNQGVPIKH